MIHIDRSTCKSCGVCGTVCPRHVTEVVSYDGAKVTRVVAERADLCMGCGHCAAVCPTGSIMVDGLDPGAFHDLAALNVSDDDLLTLLRQRRSVRRYKSRPVPRELIDRLVDAAHTAPTGTGRPSTCLLVLTERSRIDGMMQIVHQQYAALDKALQNPIARLIIRRRAGKTKLAMLDDFVMPGMRWYLRWYREGAGDEISRDCPAMMLFHGPAAEPQVNDNCTVAAFHVILMAETLGLGTCFNHLIPPVVNRSAELRQLLALPDHHEAFTAVTLGFPKHPWQRAVGHHLAEVRFID